MAARLALHARTARHALIVLVAGTAAASASPKGREAKAAFNKGIAAYQRKDYVAAALALAKSDSLEPDLETEYAWAQAERKTGNCAKAIQLYNKLLASPALPDANRDAVQQQLEECKAIVASEQATPPEPLPEKPSRKPLVTTSVEPLDPDPPSNPPEGRVWWKDPVGGSLVVLGAIGVGTGSYFMLSARAADIKTKDKTLPKPEFDRQIDIAKRHGVIGTATLSVGGALLLGGVVWYATRDTGRRGTSVSGWLAPSGGGVVACGRF